MSTKMAFVVKGEPCSKANSRKAVFFGKKPAFIKSGKALGYVKAFRAQCPQLDQPITEDVKVSITIYYASRRPDLDESLILDCMQSENVKCKKTGEVTHTINNIYVNDRQVKEKHIYWALDKADPRAEIEVEILE